MKKFQLPFSFKYWGAFMFPLGLIIWIAGQLGFFKSFLKSINFLFPGIQILLTLGFFSSLFGLYFLVFAKEKKEDEYIVKLRMESFLFAALLQMLFLIISFLYIFLLNKEPNGDSGLMLLFLAALLLFWITYIFRFNYIVHFKKNENFVDEYLDQ